MALRIQIAKFNIRQYLPRANSPNFPAIRYWYRLRQQHKSKAQVELETAFIQAFKNLLGILTIIAFLMVYKYNIKPIASKN